MSGKITHTVRMAKATTEDIESAFKVAVLVEGLHKGQHPAYPAEDDAPSLFVEDDREHLRALYDHLIKITEDKGGGLFRVVGGMHTLLASNILDPEDDCLALHPRLQPVVWEASTDEIDQALKAVDRADATAEQLRDAARILRAETLLRWEQRTALSFRLQALQRALVAANIDDQSELYQAVHDATATAEAWMHPGTLDEAVAAHIHALSALLFGPATEVMRIAGFECPAFEALTEAAVEQKGWPYSCAEAADLCAAIFHAMAAAAVKDQRPQLIGVDLASSPDMHVEADIDEEGAVINVREVPRG